MRPVVVAASLLVAGWILTPARVAAQEPKTPPPPQAVAVPRAQDPADADRNRAPERAVDRPVREPGQPTGASRREVIKTGDDGSAPRAAAAASPTPANDEDDQRRGAVRRPPGGGSGDRGRDRAVPRSQAPPPPPQRTTIVRNAPYRYYPNYSLYYDPWGYGSFGLGYFYYSPWSWSPYGAYGYSPYAYSYPRYGGAFGFDVGNVKIKVRPRDAEVWVDGYYAGIADDFDGMFQALRLDSGPYHIEIRKPGYETLTFDVRVQPGRTVTFRGDLRPVP